MYDGSYVNNRNTSKEKKVTSVTLKVYNAGLYIYIYIYICFQQFKIVTLRVHNRTVFQY